MTSVFPKYAKEENKCAKIHNKRTVIDAEKRGVLLFLMSAFFYKNEVVRQWENVNSTIQIVRPLFCLFEEYLFVMLESK